MGTFSDTFNQPRKERRQPLHMQIISVCLSFMVLTVMAVTTTSSVGAVLEARSTTLDSFEKIATSVAMAVEEELHGIQSTVEELGVSASLYISTLKESELSAYLEERARTYDFEKIYITDTAGMTGTGIDFSGYDFYKAAITGDVYISPPQVTVNKESSDIMAAAPVWKNGIKGTEIIGTVIVVMDGFRLTEIVSSVSVGETGGLYIIDSTGTTIADPSYETVLNGENTIMESETDSSLVEFAEAEKSALAGNTVITRASFDGDVCFLCAYPMKEFGWVLGAYATSWEYVGGSITMAYICVTIAAAICLVAVFALRAFIKKLTRPIGDVVDAANEVAKGNYNVQMSYTKNDEIGDMVKAFHQMIDATKDCIADVSHVLTEMSKGNFTVQPSVKYPGVFSTLGMAATTISENMRDTLSTIGNVASEVSTGADQVDSAASTLSQGTAEQAAALEELYSTLGDITARVKTTAANAQETMTLTTEVNDEIQQGNEQMHKLSDAMVNIENTSRNISAIAKSIEDIAFQTNILALNAAIEAARAGQAGKGFSVVAEEVRSLAGKASDAAKTTTEMADSALSAIATGSEISIQTAQSMETIAGHISNMSEKIIEITSASEEQSNAISEITAGVEQVSAVVQSNSATAEESAAASTSLAQEAKRLTDIFSHFKI